MRVRCTAHPPTTSLKDRNSQLKTSSIAIKVRTAPKKNLGMYAKMEKGSIKTASSRRMTTTPTPRVRTPARMDSSVWLKM